MTPPTEPPTEPADPACRPTLGRLQGVLDGDLPASALDADPHAAVCPTCGHRLRAARSLAAAEARLRPPGHAPADLTERVVAAVLRDRRARARRRALAAVGGLAAAAAVLLVVWPGGGETQPIRESASRLPGATAPTADGRPAAEPGPPPRPVHLGAEFTRTRDALRDSVTRLVEPGESAAGLFPKLAPDLPPVTPPDLPDLERARASLAEIPEAARAGLAPVADSARRAFGRLVQHVSVVQPHQP